MIKRAFTSLLLLLTSFLVFAQEKIDIGEADYANQQVEMADAFRADGKIYVVVAVILVILIGLLIYLFLIDRKVTRIENQIGNQQ
ncbi:CcmD family protein [Fulvivirga sedimenti]|uniref:CcmD family protein n=1 Tax=Fulvivirga sedimenti TaxID=2879465 RepID=A0A9X1KYU5_9BACT|nr:CcmD family protein [Fulvivirga sedimenti]MCA6078258.1 CcmD family protein [Fulvivirga sedimenti]